MVRALYSNRCESGSSPGPGVTCGLSLLLDVVLSVCFSSGLPVFLPPKNSHFKFQFDPETVNRKNHPLECPLLNYH